MISSLKVLRLFGFAGWLALALLSFQATANDVRYISHEWHEQTLQIVTSVAKVSITAYQPDVFEVHYEKSSIKQLPSFAIGAKPQKLATTLKNGKDQLRFSTGQLTAVIQKFPFKISYQKNGKLIAAEESGFFAHETLRGFRFSLDRDEKLLGTGERVLGMDRRGHRLPLYNRAHYGYTTESEQMYFSMPVILSSKKYMLVFDNSASGFIDLGKSEKDVLQFEAVAGRTSYLLIAGETYPEVLENYVSVTGRQPMPPRWALGNYASRFGYHTEKETREVVQKFFDEGFPLDAVVLDLYWFGPDIKGHVGNLEWDKSAFPNPEKMIADFKEQGVNTILVTEPFILSTSSKWNEAVEKDVLAKDLSGKSKRFDFYFGNTGLLDLFDQKAADWFWTINQGLIEQGVEGLWGDLGEPEVHPGDTIHAIGTADEVHNAYGHKWAEVIFNNHEKIYPDKRPFIMMRSGFAGSQRYGMIPWTGDVSRSWGGLKPQVELLLQMGLMGMGYIHSDLGGFAGGETFDKELYIRWLQFGIFQPVFRPHGQEHIPSEPVFHDQQTKDIVREFIKLRYRMLPYNYTLAWQNATKGIPFLRPLFFEDESRTELMDNKDSFLWGDAFLVSPVVEPGIENQSIYLPEGVWFDYWNDSRHVGDSIAEISVSLNTIPVLVRAGSFVPMISRDISSTKDYSSQELTLHYYADKSVKYAEGIMYDDDGKTHRAFAKGLYEVLEFKARHNKGKLDIELERRANAYQGMPESRVITLVVHNWKMPVKKIMIGGKSLPVVKEDAFKDVVEGIQVDERARKLKLKFRWSEEQTVLVKVN